MKKKQSLWSRFLCWIGAHDREPMAECLCDEIDPSDRPCIVCEAYEALGRKVRCKACGERVDPVENYPL